ncbi:MAG: NDP-sugar synthase [Myxococcota bacterium]|jgi:serine acetyltransferase|nr:NDP-sugar synthase [Myxococcota bacterium]
MRAVLFAPETPDAFSGSCRSQPSILLLTLDRPFLQHIIESLAELGIHRIELVVSDRPDAVEQFVGDGTRWGIEIGLHLVRDPHRPYGALRRLGLGSDEVFLLGHADRAHRCTLPAPEEELPSYHLDDEKQSWTGWAWLSANDAAQIKGSFDFEALASLLDDHRMETVSTLLSVQTPAAYLAAQRSLLDGHCSMALRSGRELEAGVWLSRNVTLGRDVILTAPVFIGPDTRIGAGARIGPHVVIGEGCVIEGGTQFEDAVVLGGTFVGEGLELRNAIARHTHIYNVEIGDGSEITDPFILSAVRGTSSKQRLSRLAGRMLGLALLAPGLSAAALARWRKRTENTVWKVGNGRGGSKELHTWLGSAQPSSGMAHFFEHVLPSMPLVAAGGLDLVGLDPRSPEEVEQMSPEWKEVYLSRRPGVISEAQVQFGDSASDPERFAAEAYYAACATSAHDFRLLGRYLRRLVKR